MSQYVNTIYSKYIFGTFAQNTHFRDKYVYVD